MMERASTSSSTSPPPPLPPMPPRAGPLPPPSSPPPTSGGALRAASERATMATARWRLHSPPVSGWLRHRPPPPRCRLASATRLLHCRRQRHRRRRHRHRPRSRPATDGPRATGLDGLASFEPRPPRPDAIARPRLHPAPRCPPPRHRRSHPPRCLLCDQHRAARRRAHHRRARRGGTTTMTTAGRRLPPPRPTCHRTFAAAHASPAPACTSYLASPSPCARPPPGHLPPRALCVSPLAPPVLLPSRSGLSTRPL